MTQIPYEDVTWLFEPPETLLRLSALDAASSIQYGRERGDEWLWHYASDEQKQRVQALGSGLWERMETRRFHDFDRWLALYIEGLPAESTKLQTLASPKNDAVITNFWDRAIGVVGDGGESRFDSQFVLGFAQGMVEANANIDRAEGAENDHHR